MKTPFDIPADLDTPVSAFLKLAPFEPRFLLESVEGGNHLGRYSFIGLGDGPQLVLSPGGARPDVGQVGAGSRELLLRRLRDALASAPRPRADGFTLPFMGGLVGFVGYDVARRLERLPAARPAPEDRPEAAFVAPRSLLAFDHLTRRAALLHDGPEREREALRREVVTALRGPLPAGAALGRHTVPEPGLTRDEFMGGVERVRNHIRAGDVFQLVLSVRFEGDCDMDPFQVYRALRLLNPSPYMYLVRAGGLTVVGSSPEALVRLEGRSARLRPIAGTRPRGETAERDETLERELLADPKEAAEHVMLVDLARNDLGRVAVPGTIGVQPYRSVERYSNVMHLVSGVHGVLSPRADAFDLFAAVFPAGTVVGAPKVRAMELIEELEPAGRGIYGGSVGYFGHGGGMDQAIAIRTLVFAGDRYAYQAGAGIVADSRPEHEHDEVLAKGAALERALALAEEL